MPATSMPTLSISAATALPAAATTTVPASVILSQTPSLAPSATLLPSATLTATLTPLPSFTFTPTPQPVADFIDTFDTGMKTRLDLSGGQWATSNGQLIKLEGELNDHYGLEMKPGKIMLLRWI